MPSPQGNWEASLEQHHLNKGSFQGYMLLSDSRIYMPGGRSTPFYLIDAPANGSGNCQGQRHGSFALLADNCIFHGPADRSGMRSQAGLTGDKAACTSMRST